MPSIKKIKCKRKNKRRKEKRNIVLKSKTGQSKTLPKVIEGIQGC